jgi:hypothetical protein
MVVAIILIIVGILAAFVISILCMEEIVPTFVGVLIVCAGMIAMSIGLCILVKNGDGHSKDNDNDNDSHHRSPIIIYQPSQPYHPIIIP